MDVFPSVTLAGPGDEVTIATPDTFCRAAQPARRIRCRSSSVRASCRPAGPRPGHSGGARAKGTVQAVDPYPIEKHLMTDGGIPSEVRQDVARKLVEAIRERLSAAGDRCDPIQPWPTLGPRGCPHRRARDAPAGRGFSAGERGGRRVGGLSR